MPFETDVAIDIIEKELGGPLGAFFSTISEEPVAAASLAQVYKAQLDDGRSVAVKVQRPQILEQVSKDLYVLRRAAEVYQRLIDRFAPQQKTNYVDLLNEWAVGFYTELDFRSEIDNLNAIRDVLVRVEISQWSAPLTWTTSRRWRGGRRFDFRAGARRGRARGAARRARRGPRRHDGRRRLRPLRTGRIMHGSSAVTEWIDGVKLSTCEPHEIKRLTPVAQEAFLVQLLEAGIFHADPHPGNLFRKDDGQLAILDFGLVARVRSEDQDTMINAIVHLANKDFPSLVDDFIDLEILPRDTSRGTVVPLMDKALSPYIAGGGAKKFEERVRASYGIDDGRRSRESGGRLPGHDAGRPDGAERRPVLHPAVLCIAWPSFCDAGRHRFTRRSRLRHHPGGLPLRVAQALKFGPARGAARAQEALYAGAGRDDGSEAPSVRGGSRRSSLPP